MRTLGLILIYGCIYGMWGWWLENTDYGKATRHFLQNWNTDWKHGLMVSVTVFIFGVCAILALGLLFKVMGV